MTGSEPEQPFEEAPGPPLDYPDDAGLPPPLYPPPYPGAPGAGSYSPYPAYPGYPARPPGTNGKAVAALVTSVAGIVCCGVPSIVGLVLGIIAMRETRRTGQSGYGLALASVIISGVLVAAGVVYIVARMLLSAGGGQ